MQGKLDFQSYPERLCVADVVPGMVNAMMLLICDGVRDGIGEGERMECELDRMEHDEIAEDAILFNCSDHTGKFLFVHICDVIWAQLNLWAGSIDIVFKGFGQKLWHIYPSQVLYMFV